MQCRMAGDSEVPARQSAARRNFLKKVLNFFEGCRMEGAFIVPEEGLPKNSLWSFQVFEAGPGSRAATAAGQEGTGENEGGC